MRIQRVHEWGGPERLTLDTVDTPEPGPGEIRVRVAAIGVNPVDWKLMTGKAPVPMALPLVPGGDIAGTVDAVGEGVTGPAVGDRVFALVGLRGAYAEQVVVRADLVAAVPDTLDLAAAAALPLVALTAWQGLLADGRDPAGLEVLVHGGAGGVGSAAIQIAVARGARVTATASARNADYVRGLGAAEVIDFRTDDPAPHAGRFDMLIDLVGTSQETGLWRLVRAGGSVIRVGGGATAPEQETVDGVRAIKVRVRPDGGQLAEIARLAAAGGLTLAIQQRFAFADAADALRLVKEGHVRGKVVLTLP